MDFINLGIPYFDIIHDGRFRQVAANCGDGSASGCGFLSFGAGSTLDYW